MGLEAELGQAVDHAAWIERPVPPFEGEPAVGQVHTRARDIGHEREIGLDPRHAGRAGDALDRKVHAGEPAVEMLDEARQIAQLDCVPNAHHFRITRLRDRNRRSPPRSASITRSHWPGATSDARPR